MNVRATELPGVLVIEPRVHGDARGEFWEAFHGPRYAAAGVPGPMTQTNFSRSARGVLRGLHFQEPRPQGKLCSVPEGAVFDVAVDLRPESPAFGRWFGLELSAANRLQLWIPPGCAHGFQVITDSAIFCYQCTDVYAAEADRGLRWDDPDLAIPWPLRPPALSAKDAALPTLAQWLAGRAPAGA